MRSASENENESGNENENVRVVRPTLVIERESEPITDDCVQFVQVLLNDVAIVRDYRHTLWKPLEGMKLAHLTRLEDFGTRSLVVHSIMVVTFAGAILSGLFVDGQLGSVSFVALLNFTAGLWVAHSVHSLGNVATDDEYNGILNELLDTDRETGGRFDTGRFGRLLALIGAVTAVSLLTSAQVLGGALLSIAIVAVGTVGLITAIVGFLIALGASYDESQNRTVSSVEQYTDEIDAD